MAVSHESLERISKVPQYRREVESSSGLRFTLVLVPKGYPLSEAWDPADPAEALIQGAYLALLTRFARQWKVGVYRQPPTGLPRKKLVETRRYPDEASARSAIRELAVDCEAGRFDTSETAGPNA